MNIGDLKRAVALTSGRIGKANYVNLESIEKICLVLDCKVEKKVEIGKGEA